MKLNTPVKIILVILFFICSVIGFLVKLPSGLHHIDKELHTLFYFAAAAFLNLLFMNKNIIRHAAIFISLYLFGIAIEYAQEYSNKLFHKRIHGRYDPEDVHANLKGLVLFSIAWIVCIALLFVYNKGKSKKIEENHNKPTT